MSESNPKIIFFGTSDFAATILQRLYSARVYDLPMVVTQPDQPVGRKQVLTAPPVKTTADSLNLPIIQPDKLDAEVVTKLRSFQADLFIVAAYGNIIPEKILNLPRFGCLNLHPSLLPHYRGPSPIQWTLMNGDKKTGLTIILLDKKMDHGPIINQIDFPISPTDNFVTLSQKLADESAKLLIKTIPGFISNKIKPTTQNHALATYTKIIAKNDGQINWSDEATKIYNLWRAFITWPNIFSTIKIHGKDILIKFNEIKPTEGKPERQYLPGQLFTQNKKLLATCGGGTYLEILKLQPEGKKIITADEFINGYLK